MKSKTEGNIPTDFAITSVRPNPFNSTTTISYVLPEGVNAQIIVYNISGQMVANLFDGVQAAGSHSIVWNAERNPAGIYCVRLQSGDFTSSHKLVLMK